MSRGLMHGVVFFFAFLLGAWVVSKYPTVNLLGKVGVPVP